MSSFSCPKQTREDRSENAHMNKVNLNHFVKSNLTSSIAQSSAFHLLPVFFVNFNQRRFNRRCPVL